MLYLRTGGNGTGKTLFTLRDLRDMQLAENRPVCVNSRFKIYPEKLKEFGWRVIEFKDWQDQPDGTIFMMDEVHYDMPLRANSSAVPDAIAKLTEHRSRGFDFFLLTQHPMNIDGFVRKLIQAPGYHRHYKRVFGGLERSIELQWNAVKTNCEQDGSGNTAQSVTRTFPKEVYDWYESAERHTAKVRIPKQVYVGIACLVGVVALGFAVYLRLKPADKPPAKPAETQTVHQATTPAQQSPQAAQGAEKHVVSPAELVASYQPRIEGMPQTAPRYDSLTAPTAAPYPAACVHMKPRCQCYSQQGTKLDVPMATCLQIVEKGFFVDWQAGPTNAATPVNHSMPPPGQTQQVAAAAVPVAIGMQAGTKAAP